MNMTATLSHPITPFTFNTGVRKYTGLPSAFGFQFSDQSLEAVTFSIAQAAQHNLRTRIAFVNAHCVNEMNRSRVYEASVRTADMVLADGSGMDIACRLASGRKCPNHNGTDLAPELFKTCQNWGLSVYLLGARPGVAETAGQNLQEQFPGLKIAGTHHGYFEESETDEIIQKINKTNPDIILVAFGVPQQDIWLAENAEKLLAPVTMGVGGLLDFISGRIPRAPKFLRKTGLEWLYRLYQEPTRMWQRYILGNPIFLLRAIFSAAKGPLQQLKSKIDEMMRRIIDIIGASIGLLILGPLFAALMIAIRSESYGPALFKQVRVGKDGVRFTMYKFRSMGSNAEYDRNKIIANNHHGDNSVTFKIKNDPRITPIGRFIRKFSIDELPQLWNVLIGDMSLVGPRPALENEVLKYTQMERRRLAVKPGITCTWQISGRADIDFTGQVALDLQYIRHRSIFHDLIILLKTPIAVITARGAY